MFLQLTILLGVLGNVIPQAGATAPLGHYDNCWVDGQARSDLCPEGQVCLRHLFEGSTSGCVGYHCCVQSRIPDRSLELGDNCWAEASNQFTGAQHHACPENSLCLRRHEGQEIGCLGFHCCTNVAFNLGDDCWVDDTPRHDFCPGESRCMRKKTVSAENKHFDSYSNIQGCDDYHCCTAPKLEENDDCWRIHSNEVSTGFADHDVCPEGHECLRSFHLSAARGGDLGCRDWHCCTNVQNLAIGDGCFDAWRNEGRDDLCPKGSICRRKGWLSPDDTSGCDNFHCCWEDTQN